jgi:hypothetical protein
MFCLANVIGFLALFAPAGIGVRKDFYFWRWGRLWEGGRQALLPFSRVLAQTMADIFFAAFGLINFYCVKECSSPH